MSKKKKVEKVPFELSELAQLKIENVILKMNGLKDEVQMLNQKFMTLANYRDHLIEEARKETGAPAEFMVNSNITHFIQPPPSPTDPPSEE